MSQPIEHDTILLVDDDPVARLLTASVLEQHAFRVIQAGSGREALAKFVEHACDCVLLDALMPGMNGFDTCEALRKLPGGGNVPVLMLTGLDDEGSIARAYEAGATDFFVKSTQWTLLAQRARYLLRASRMRAELEQSRSKLAKAQRIARLGSWEWDLASDCVIASDICFAIAGVAPSSRPVPAAQFFQFIHPDDSPTFLGAVTRLRTSAGEFDIEVRAVGPQGEDVFVHIEAEAERDANDCIFAIAGTTQDITQRKRAEAQILSLANYDSLTGLPNRRLFQEALSGEIDAASRKGGRLAALFVDLDRFKNVNDTQGHGAGDALLREVAERLSQCVRWREGSRDIVARIGGDEFVILLTAISEPHHAHRVAERMLEALRKPFVINGHENFISASIGIARFPEDGTDAESLMRNADAAMYSVKAQGRNDLRVYTPELNVADRQRWELEKDLHKALERDELVLHYQPQIDAQTGEIIGAEALMRWNHGGKLVPPGIFIPIAEDTGIIASMGEWALITAARQAAEWIAQGLPPVRVAVNIPGSHFQRPGFVEMIETTLREAHLPATLLELEITETMLMQDVSSTIASLKQLKKLGVRLSIDDFGTGYSSFAYLKRFDIEQLKIDKSFIADMNEDNDNEIITAAIIAMGRTLKLEIVAEGVETREQVKLLQRHGCHLMQGYYFSKPVPAANLTALLTELASGQMPEHWKIAIPTARNGRIIPMIQPVRMAQVA
jgi:diguanylate cyclase (GGDEF)-like protein